MYEVKIDRLLEGWRGEYAKMLKRWVGIDSVAREPAGEGMPFGVLNREMLDMAIADARAMGFDAAVIDGYAGHVQMGEGAQTMGILAHLDVVPAGDGWTHPPFGGEIEDGWLYGRGASDNKGPALAALFAMRAVKESGVPLQHAVRLILGCDEEVGMTDMRHYASVTKMPDYGFSPDAGYPIINIEKGGLSLRISGEAGETGARLPVYSMSAGERVNVVPSVAVAVVGAGAQSAEAMRAKLAELKMDITLTELGDGRAQIEAHGVSSHGAQPEDGVNAAGMLLIALRYLGADGKLGGMIAALVEKLGMEYDGKALGIDITEAESGPLTCNLGLLRFDGRKLSVDLDIRYPIGADEVDMCGKAVMAFSDARMAVARLHGRPVLHMPKDHPIVRGLLDVYHEVTGLKAYTISMGGGTYARMMPNTVAFGSTFPDQEPDNYHAPDERVNLERMILSARVMAHAIVKLAGA